MMSERPWLQAAIAEGLLPSNVAATLPSRRPLPVVALSALGAWLVALPMIGLLSALLASLGSRTGMLVLGIILLGVALALLRGTRLSIFLEQLGFAILVAGMAALTGGLNALLDVPATALLLACLCLSLAAVLEQAWLRALLGAAAAAFALAIADEARLWLALHLLLGAALVLAWRMRTLPARIQLRVDGPLAGWLGTLLIAAIVFGVGKRAPNLGQGALSSVLAMVGYGALARAWPSLLSRRLLPAAMVLAALAWWQTTLGVVLIIAALAARQRHWPLLILSGVCALAAIGLSYYQLDWSLAQKAWWLVAAALALGLLAWQPGAAQRAAPAWQASVALGLSLVATLAVINVGIWQKEELIRTGRPVFIALQPADPRSLMQGDYMRLNFLPLQSSRIERDAQARLCGRTDARGVLADAEIGHGACADPAMTSMALHWRGQRWMLVTDAWYFKEAEGVRFAAARYGEFRVTPTGEALLVGLRDADLKPL
ncbi:GDYXXLXY domain-containing protein [Massilia sp. TS11]|uniref:GDYXXLXY domain-containing protein n=1 Tax=Massilia sp. TS11 TaxID=2908003 RepID=UPI001EDB2495|nr:GDYXXLXY domain-containing protein [Massilia sp. TS11]MCG2586882.1 GDYXXLXY domain-containing protein [Massilia sp. TS11]